ncbi:S-layer homology domain-containing protein [bacterium]|nr:S-layer homology domain-containing protein [bacterium]
MVQFQNWLLVPAAFMLAFCIIGLRASPANAEDGIEVKLDADEPIIWRPIDLPAYQPVPTSSWAYPAMRLMVQHGQLDGYPDFFWDAKQILTRMDFAYALSQLTDIYASDMHVVSGPTPAEDSEVSQRKEVQHLIALALLDEFIEMDPARPVPQWASWSCRDAVDQSVLTAYDDVSYTHWAYAAVNYFFKTGALEGYPNYFQKDRTLTRYEFALATARVLDHVDAGLATKPEAVLAAALRAEFIEQLDILASPNSPAEKQAAVTALSGRAFAVDSPYTDVDPRSWDYKALDYLVRQRVLEGYPNDFFNGRTLTRYEITQATARLLDTLGPQRDISPELLMAEALRDKYRDQLELLSEALDRSMIGVGCVLYGPPGSEPVGMPPFVATDPSTSAYADVKLGHWSYYALDYLTGKGILEGYPKDFFKGDRTLTRYEFAQAVARLLDTVSSLPGTEAEGEWSVDLILAYALREEFDDQLAELSHLVNRL